MRPVFDAQTLLRWCQTGAHELAAARDEIDALNVFPVPDGDTGTNMFLTVESAAAAAESAMGGLGASVTELAGAIAAGALTGARGNSGTILAQMLKGIADVLAERDTLADAETLARGLIRAADEAFMAVAEPVDGTILSVARTAGQAAHNAATVPTASLAGVAIAAARAGRAALEDTPKQLEVLRAAGVVDAGGRGLTVLLDALETVLTGRSLMPSPRPVVLCPPNVGSTPSTDSPTYEVTYLLDAPGEQIDELKATLASLGASLVIGGGNGMWNVHVHVDDPGAALEAGTRAGRPHRVTVTGLGPCAGLSAGSTSTRVVLAFASVPGLAELYEASGAVPVVPAAGHQVARADVVAAARRAGAHEVVVLPNERDSLTDCETAVVQLRDTGRRAVVLPTVSHVQALAALSARQPERPFDDDVVAMTAAIGHVRHGALVLATDSDDSNDGGGNVRGIVGDKDVVTRTDELATASRVATRLLASGGELVTVVVGVDAPAGLAQGLVAAVQAAHPDVETVVYYGGQPRYPLLIGVE